MKKNIYTLAFVCTAAMLIACGDDSSSADDTTESSISNWAHEPTGDYACVSAKDTTTMLWYVYDGADSALEVMKIEYPIEYEEAVEECEGVFAENAKEQNVDCDSVIATINLPQNMTFDALMSLAAKECIDGKVINAVDLTDPGEAPENSLWKSIKNAAKKIGDGSVSLWHYLFG